MSSSKRDSLLKSFDANKIETRLSFPPVHIKPFYSKKFGFKVNEFKEAIKCFRSFIDIPIWAEMGEQEQNRVVGHLKKFIGREDTL